MPTYLYCLVSAGTEAPAAVPPGIDGAPVRRLPAGRVAAWVSDVAARDVAPTLDGARAHDRVVRAAMAVETPLPARFGQTFGDDAALGAAIAEREAALVEALARVRGAVEMTVRVLLDDGGAPEVSPSSVPRRGLATEAAASSAAASSAATPDEDAVAGAASPPRDEAVSGREYLSRLRARSRAAAERRGRAEFLQKQVSAAVAGLVRSEARAPLADDAHSLVISHLVPAHALDRYRAAVRTLRGGATPLRLLITGPWAPYSFAMIPTG